MVRRDASRWPLEAGCTTTIGQSQSTQDGGRSEWCTSTRGTRHGPIARDWLRAVLSPSWFEYFQPHRRAIPPPLGSAVGQGRVFTDLAKHPNAVVIPCCPPHPLANPWATSAAMSPSDGVELCDQLMLYGGSAAEWGGEPGGNGLWYLDGYLSEQVPRERRAPVCQAERSHEAGVGTTQHATPATTKMS